MKIQTTWTFGNFSITAATDVEGVENPSPLVKAMLEDGFLQTLQRVPSSRAEKHVAGGDWPKNKKGEPERPKDFKRNSIPYSDETALELAEGFGTSVNIGTTEAPLPLKFAIVNVVEHDSGTAVSMKRATALVDAAWEKEDDRKVLFSLLKMLGMQDAEKSTREQAIAFAHSKGLGAKG